MKPIPYFLKLGNLISKSCLFFAVCCLVVNFPLVNAVEPTLSDFDAAQRMLELATKSQISSFASKGDSLISTAQSLTSKVQGLRQLGINTSMTAEIEKQASALANEGLKAREYAGKLSGSVDGLGNTISAAKIIGSVVDDTTLYGRTAPEIWRTSLIGTADVLNVFFSKAWPLASLGLAAWAVDKVDSQSSIAKSASIVLKGVSDPAGALIDDARLLRELLKSLGDTDEMMMSSVDSMISQADKTIARKAWAGSAALKISVLNSNSLQEFQVNADASIAEQRRFSQQQAKGMADFVQTLRSANGTLMPWFLPGNATRQGIYESLIDRLNSVRRQLVAFDQALADPSKRGDYLKPLADSWMVASLSRAEAELLLIRQYESNLNRYAKQVALSTPVSGGTTGGNTPVVGGAPTGGNTSIASCPTGDGRYCGNGSAGRLTGTLYACRAGSYTVAQTCAAGCVKAPAGSDDYCQSDSTPSTILSVAKALFPGKATNHDYNGWGACPSNFCAIGRAGYVGGHAGLDIQTQSRGADTFHSLSNGVVVGDGSNGVGAIAVFDQVRNLTLVYLHSARSLVKINDSVKVGDPIGVQGDKGAAGAFHVHVEARSGRHDTGTAQGKGQTLDPVSTVQSYLSAVPPPSPIIEVNVFDFLPREIVANGISKFAVQTTVVAKSVRVVFDQVNSSLSFPLNNPSNNGKDWEITRAVTALGDPARNYQRQVWAIATDASGRDGPAKGPFLLVVKPGAGSAIFQSAEVSPNPGSVGQSMTFTARSSDGQNINSAVLLLPDMGINEPMRQTAPGVWSITRLIAQGGANKPFEVRATLKNGQTSSIGGTYNVSTQPVNLQLLSSSLSSIVVKDVPWVVQLQMNGAANRAELVFDDAPNSPLAFSGSGANWNLSRPMTAVGNARSYTIKVYPVQGSTVFQQRGTLTVTAPRVALPPGGGTVQLPVAVNPSLTVSQNVRVGSPITVRLLTNVDLYSAVLEFSNGKIVPLSNASNPREWEAKAETARFAEPGIFQYSLKIRQQINSALETSSDGTLEVIALAPVVITPTVISATSSEQGKPYTLQVRTSAPVDRVTVQFSDSQGEQGLAVASVDKTSWTLGSRLFSNATPYGYTLRTYRDGTVNALGTLQGSINVTLPSATLRLVGVSNNVKIGEAPTFTVNTSLSVQQVSVRLGNEGPVSLANGGSSGVEYIFRGNVPARSVGNMPYVIMGTDTAGRQITATGTLVVLAATSSVVGANPMPLEVFQGETKQVQFNTTPSSAQLWLEVQGLPNRINLVGPTLTLQYTMAPGTYTYRLMGQDSLGNNYPVTGASGQFVVKVGQTQNAFTQAFATAQSAPAAQAITEGAVLRYKAADLILFSVRTAQPADTVVVGIDQMSFERSLGNPGAVYYSGSGIAGLRPGTYAAALYNKNASGQRTALPKPINFTIVVAP
jgi:murein DD-endopeptidase MepM/ murein hydrolase activator NlpD